MVTKKKSVRKKVRKKSVEKKSVKKPRRGWGRSYGYNLD
jgi:hypothetical protein